MMTTGYYLRKVTDLTLELEQAKNQAATFKALLDEANAKYVADNVWRKQTDSEINMLRRKIAIKTKSEEDTIASEAKKRRLLEVQIVELKAKQQNTTGPDANMNKLVADVKAQLANGDAELQLVKGQLNDERNKAQEENENQRKELEATKAAFESERKSWIETRLRLEANLESLKAEAQRKVDEIAKQLEDERKQRKVDQMMYETLLKNNLPYDQAASPTSSPSQSPPQSPTESPVPSPLLLSASPPTTSVPPIASPATSPPTPSVSTSSPPTPSVSTTNPPTSSVSTTSPPTSSPPTSSAPTSSPPTSIALSSTSTSPRLTSTPDDKMPENPRYSSPLPPGPPSRPGPPTTAHPPSTLGNSGGVTIKTTTTNKPKAKDGTRSFFGKSGKK